MTARLAVEIRNLPDWDVDWNDTTPQCDPTSLTITDILPSECDGVILRKRAIRHVMHILVEEFPSLANMQTLLPSSDTQSIRKSNVVPMKILFKDEKYKSETIDILIQLARDGKLSGKPEVSYASVYTHTNIVIQSISLCVM